MGLFKLKKNKRYSHSGRYSEDNSYLGKYSVSKKIKSKFNDYRTTVGNDNSFRKKFRNAVDDYKKGSEKSVKIRLVIILSILVSLFLLFFFI
ncbi:MAG: riboflavin synthase subunit beta [Flavobacteriaceae bacterium]|nr:riboflavin synthase subunit beta [Flavobacteriaceae bacterium]